MKAPQDCKSIEEIREAIDSIDYDILQLLGERFAYVKEIVKFKTDEDSIIAAPRKEQVLKQRRVWADEIGLSPDVVENIYTLLISYFISEEKKIMENNNNK